VTSLRSAVRQLFWVLLTLLSHYRRHPGQTAFMAIGLLTGVALWASVQLINDHARASYEEANQLLGAESAYWIRNKQGAGIAVEAYIDLRTKGFTEVYPVIESRLVTTSGKVIPIIATDLLALPLDSYGSSGDASSPLAGTSWLDFIQPNYQTWYPAALAARLEIVSGDEVGLANGNRMPPALIQAREQQGLRAFMDVGAAFSVLGAQQFSYLAVTSLDAAKQRQLEATLPSSLTLVKNQQVLDLTQLTESLHTHLTAMGLLSFAVGLFIVFNAVRFSLLTRQATFSSLQELGASVPLIGIAIIFETVLWSLLGTIGGIAIGYLLSGVLLPTVAGSLQSLYGAIIDSNVQLEPLQILLAWLMTLIGLVFALAGPLWSRLNISIVEGRSSSSLWYQDARARNVMMWFSLLLTILAVGFFFRISSVVDGFVVLALILFSGALILPALIHLVIWGAQMYFAESQESESEKNESNWKWRWAISDAFAQLPQLRIALMALLLTLTANIGVTTLVDSFRHALTDWLELRLSADIYVQTESLTAEQLAMAKTEQWLTDGHFRTGISTRWRDRPTRIQGLDTDAPDTLGMALAEQSVDGFERWARGNQATQRTGSDNIQPILANEQAKYLGGIKLGETITLDAQGDDYLYEVVGFFHDYGSAYYRFYLPRATLESRWQNVQSEGLALWVAPDSYGSAEAYLLAMDVKPGEWILQSDIKRVSLEIFDRTFAITAALNSLTLLVAGIALLAALLAVHQQRLSEYAHWHSLGVTFSEWLKLVAAPLGLMVLVTGIVALPLGWILSWMLVNKLNVVAFGWTMPLVWSWPPVMSLGFVTSLVVVLALGLVVFQVRKRLPEALKQLGGLGL
jgi:putative ABC transport system permease protein